ncbi:uncharacterized protein BDZ99DRAFT_519475 [Mytilinidion resinicola]|uniref:Uncharacterized protein n=1 Tax=Mytilinidion resinicola TaxID=574789 RepID=A0A6A6YQI9_9PEZI|nr:uncharacterized protein BDZ99DRAFT_519475 [Mytilinidion resinicola]KAF2810798.1 hypothetical protein BDZ99DRAFT_519475 [Mytilinidion resinicola]
MAPRRSARLAARRAPIPNPSPIPTPSPAPSSSPIYTRTRSKVTFKITKPVPKITTLTIASSTRITKPPHRTRLRTPRLILDDEASEGTASSTSTARSFHSSGLSASDMEDHLQGDTLNSDSEDSRFGSDDDNENYFNDSGFVLPNSSDESSEEEGAGSSGYDGDASNESTESESSGLSSRSEESASEGSEESEDGESEEEEEESPVPCPVSRGSEEEEDDALPVVASRGFARRRQVRSASPSPTPVSGPAVLKS